MLAVLTVNGHSYPLGPPPMGDWPGYLDSLEAALAAGLRMERVGDPPVAVIRNVSDNRVIYRIHQAPWPSDGGAAYLEAWAEVAEAARSRRERRDH